MAAIYISLLVPSFNRPSLLRETVESLVANAAGDIEIIISDDNSPRQGEIRAALQPYLGSERIHYLQQKKQLRWSANRNALVRAARGEYVMLLGDDDRLKPGAIQRLRPWIGRRPDLDILGIGYDQIDSAGRVRLTFCTPRFVQYQVGHGNEWKELFFFDAVAMWSHHPFTMLSKRSVALSIPYSSEVGIGDDTLYLYQALNRGFVFGAIPEVLLEWRTAFPDAGDAFCNLSSDTAKCWRARGLVLATMLNSSDLRSEVRELLQSRTLLARYSALRGSELESLRALVAQRPVPSQAVGDLLEQRSARAREPLHRKATRHLRAVRVLGAAHLLQVIRHQVARRSMVSSTPGAYSTQERP
jgi:glycosyltransferase involved in cell wall biosynthesis